MLKKISKIPFKGTPEQEAQLKAVIEECKDNKSLLMHVMQQAQAIYGYLPFEVQAMYRLKRFTEYPLFTLSLRFPRRESTTSLFVSVRLAMLRVRRNFLTRFVRSLESEQANVRTTVCSRLRLAVVSARAVLPPFSPSTMRFTESLLQTMYPAFLPNTEHNYGEKSCVSCH